MKEYFKKYKLYIIIGVCTLILLVGGTLAYYTWKSTSNAVVNAEACTPEVYFSGGANVTATDLVPVLTKEEGIVKNITVNKKSACNSNVTMNLYLDLETLPTELADSSFVYELYKNGTKVTNGNFASKTQGQTITLVSNTTVNTTKDTYILYIYINGNSDNPATMANKTFNFKLHADGSGAIYKTLAAEMITSLYNNATKTTVTNNDITYNTAPSVSLMNDRLGGTTTDLNGGNIRYYGATPNNYIYFNCSDYSNQTSSTCETWRIIGVFNGKLKIIRNTSIGNYSWDNKNASTGAENAYGKNDWTTARLMKLLNPSDYYTTDSNDNGLGQSLYYNSASGKCYKGSDNATVDCDFTSTGIKNDTTKKIISEEVWHLGGWTTYLVYSNQMYGYERGTTVYSGRPTVWTGKIGLMYPSDYGYATDLSMCSEQLGAYNKSACISNNWLSASRTGKWTLTNRSNYSHAAWYVDSGDSALDYFLSVKYSNNVYPVLYLASDLTMESGNGSSSNPYKLSGN